MKEQKFLIWISLLLLFAGQTHAMEINQRPVPKASEKDLSDLTPTQKHFLNFYKCFRCCQDNQDDTNVIKERLFNDIDVESQVPVNRELTQADLDILHTTEEDTPQNSESPNFNYCLGCMELFKNNVLNKYVHRNADGHHHSTCYECEKHCRDLYSGDICAMCRRPSRKEISDYLKTAMTARRVDINTDKQIHDGSAFPIFFFNTCMTVISFYLSEANKLLPEGADMAISNVQENFSMLMNGIYTFMGEYAFMGEYIGEGENNYPIPRPFSMWDIQQMTRDGYFYLMLVSIAFLYHTRNSVSHLLDGRGVIMTLIPIFMAIVTKVNINVASYLVMLPLPFIVGDIFWKGKYIVSKRFWQYVKRYPQILFMQTNYLDESEKGIKKSLNNLINYFLYANQFGALAAVANMEKLATSGTAITTMSNWFTSGACVIGSHGYAACNPKGTKAAKILIGLNLVWVTILLGTRLTIEFSKRRPIFNFKEGILIAAAAFMLNHSTAVESVFIAINFFEMGLMMVILLVCLCLGAIGSMGG
jgi:hypothetical protein